jgi:hypothetical protein
VGATEAEYADMEYGCLGALQLACQRRPIDAEDPAVSHERDLLQTTAQAALAAGSEFWPVRTLLTEKHQWQQTHLPNGDCHVELLTRKPCPGGKHDGGSDLCVLGCRDK